MGRLPADKRAAALRLQLPEWSPFRSSGYAVGWTPQGVALVWCWDQERLDAALAAQGLKPGTLALIPESALRPAAEQDGLRLLASLQGFEVQHWQGGELLASRWWPARPTAPELLAFQRDCNLLDASEVAALAPLDIAMARDPWVALSSPAGSGGLLAAPELAAYGLVCLALGVPAVSLAVDQWRLHQAAQKASAELAQQTERSKDVLVAREAALDAVQQARALEGLQRYPAPLVLMVAVARALPEDGSVFVKEWEMSDGKLRLLLASAAADISGAEYVRALEQSRLFGDVKIVTQADPRQMAFVMALRTQDALDEGLSRPQKGG